MTKSFKKFLASILILSDNEYDRSDLADLGKTLEKANEMPYRTVVSRVPDDDCDRPHLKSLENRG